MGCSNHESQEKCHTRKSTKYSVLVSECLLAFPGCYNIALFDFLSRSILCFTLVYLLKDLHLLYQFLLNIFICIILSYSKNLVLAFSFFSCCHFISTTSCRGNNYWIASSSNSRCRQVGFETCSTYIERNQFGTFDWAFRYFSAGMPKYT